MAKVIRVSSVIVFVISWCLRVYAQDNAFPNTQEITSPLLSAEEALELIELPDGFQAQVFACEPQVQQPIAMTFDPRGRVWVAENYTYSDRSENFNLDLHDRIIILDDEDGDGVADKRNVFHDKLQRLTSVEIGFGGVWAMCPPHLLFIPDADGDDVPDGEPIVMLEGWDDGKVRHNFANGLRWGPDGWLYGRHGIMATSIVGTPDSAQHERTEMNCGIWRFHPTEHRFEVVCNGTTNPFGMDWDQHGELFFINTVIGHLWHAIPGAHFERMYGEDFNPYLYELIDQTADHVHWDQDAEAWTAQKNGLSEGSDAAGGGHAHSGMMIYQEDNWPEEYRHNLFTLNLHGRRVNQERLRRKGATYVGEHQPDLFKTSDPWFRGIEICAGPDGSVYVLDWSDIGECHENDGVHRTSGRIYRIHYEPNRTRERQYLGNVMELNDQQLVELLLQPNEWGARQARHALHQRATGGADMSRVHQLLRHYRVQRDDAVTQLRVLWALNLTGGIDEDGLISGLEHPSEYVRCWAIRLLLDRGTPSLDAINAFQSLAKTERSGLVQTYLASAMQKLPHAARWPIALSLTQSNEFALDRVLPLMIWYGIEPAVPEGTLAAFELIAASEIPAVNRLVARRVVGEKRIGNNNLVGLVALIADMPDEAKAKHALAGLDQALRGWQRVEAPGRWDDVVTRFEADEDEKLVLSLLELSVVFGRGRAVEEIMTIAKDNQQSIDSRRTAIRSLVDARIPEIRELLTKLITDRDLGGEAVRGLGIFDLTESSSLLTSKYSSMGRLGKNATIDVLATRPDTARALLTAVSEGEIPRKDVPAFVLRQMQMLGDESLSETVAEMWPETRLIAADKLKLVEDYKGLIQLTSLTLHDSEKGKELFAKHCATCHKLFGEGSEIGPELTGGQRDNLTYWLENIVDPSAEVASSFRMSVVELEDGRVLNGVVLSRTDQQLTLQTQQEMLVFANEDIFEVTLSPFSLMPDGILSELSEEEILNLFAYLTAGTKLHTSRENLVPLYPGSAKD